jgi:hypothetical protein
MKMPFHIKRTDTSKLDTLQQYNGIRSTRWVTPPPEGKSVLEVQTTHTPMALQKVPEGKNYLTPPYHCMFFLVVVDVAELVVTDVAMDADVLA